MSFLNTGTLTSFHSVVDADRGISLGARMQSARDIGIRAATDFDIGPDSNAAAITSKPARPGRTGPLPGNAAAPSKSTVDIRSIMPPFKIVMKR